MHIVISGGTGFLGQPLANALTFDGHAVTILSRHRAAHASAAAQTVGWTPDGSATGPWTAVIDGAGAVINLAGEPIAGARWTPAQKERILDSRVRATRSLAGAISRAARPPA